MKYTIKLFYRNFRKNFTVNVINVGGLTLSMAVVLMLAAYCYSELTTDLYHADAKQKFLVGSSHDLNENEIVTPGILADHLMTEIPEIQNVVRLAGTWSPPVVKTQNGESFETNLMYADNGFFDMFSYTVVAGELGSALADPFSAVLSEEEATRLFGSTDVVGQHIILNNQYHVKVTAVISAMKYNSFLDFEILLPVSAIPKIPLIDNDFNTWTNWLFMTFVHLRNEATVENAELSIEAIFDAHKSTEDELAPDIRLIPVRDVYFSNIDNAWLDFLVIGNKPKVLILTMVAVLIFFMAIINYLNISSFGLQDKMHLSGLFKIIGANQKQLFKSSMLEAVITFVGVGWLAIILAEVLRPSVQRFTGLAYSEEILLAPGFIAISIGLVTSVGIVSNLMNAIKTASTLPINSVRKRSANNKGNLFQGALVVIQFCATISLISFTILINKQIKFGGKDLGFENENIIAIEQTAQLNNEVLKERLLNQSHIETISLTTFYPTKPCSQWGAHLMTEGGEKYIQFTVIDGDANFKDMIGLELISGRNFSNKIETDRNKVLVNESFVKKHEIKNPIGASINDRFEIIGVVRDFHFKAKNYAIAPLVILNRGAVSHILVKTYSGNFEELSDVVESIKEISAELSPDFPVEVSFLDTAVENMYRQEIQFRRSFTSFSGCSVLISCLGILALSLFASQKRTKEIGIRKVNGAHVEDVLLLLNKDFIRWVCVAFIIATPIAWYAMNKWLGNYAYKTEIRWWIFLLGGGIALFIALLTVSWQSWTAARKNPVEALRYE
ncbi:MAG: ABC transporter permease [Cytophagales bacterium]|nr:ABC transporter permease [Cytophagales bacterium]